MNRLRASACVLFSSSFQSVNRIKLQFPTKMLPNLNKRPREEDGESAPVTLKFRQNVQTLREMFPKKSVVYLTEKLHSWEGPLESLVERLLVDRSNNDHGQKLMTNDVTIDLSSDEEDSIEANSPLDTLMEGKENTFIIVSSDDEGPIAGPSNETKVSVAEQNKSLRELLSDLSPSPDFLREKASEIGGDEAHLETFLENSLGQSSNLPNRKEYENRRALSKRKINEVPTSEVVTPLVGEVFKFRKCKNITNHRRYKKDRNWNNKTNKDKRWRWCGIGKRRKKGLSVGSRKYFKEVLFGGEERVKLGDKVWIERSRKELPEVGIIRKFFQESGGSRFAHVQLFQRCSESFIGGIPRNESELFLLNCCKDFPLTSILKTCFVRMEDEPDPSSWREKADVESTNTIPISDFWCRFGLNMPEGRINYLKPLPRSKDISKCPLCETIGSRNNPVLEDEMEDGSFSSVIWDQKPLSVGDGIFYGDKKKVTSNLTINESVANDKELYPEQHRKQKIAAKKPSVVPPFKLGMIKRIFKRCSDFEDTECDGCGADCAKIWISLMEFIRPEDTKEEGEAESFVNEVYYTNEVCLLKLSDVKGRVWIRYVDSESESIEDLDIWTAAGENRWFFKKKFNHKSKKVVDPPEHNKTFGRDVIKSLFTYPELRTKLTCLDIFCGAGGFSQGLSEAGVSDSKWAIEIDEPAARAYQLNHPNCRVMNEDCREVLRALMTRQDRSPGGVVLPRRGEVELLVGGPPCQGFTKLNMFTAGDKSQDLNDLVRTYLSYCDVLRPDFFVMENVTGKPFKQSWPAS